LKVLCNAAQTQCHLHLRHCLATPKQLLCLFPTPFSPTPQSGHHGSPVQSSLRSFRHADHASGWRTSGTTSRGSEPPPTLSSRAPTSFAPEESPASPSPAWRSAPAPAAPPCPHRAAVGVAAVCALRRRRAASAAPARTRATPRCGSRLGVRPSGGPRPIGRRGGRCVPVAAARWGGGVPTLRRRRPSGWPPKAAPTRAHAQRRQGAPAGGGEDHRQRGAGSGVPQPRPGATPSGGGGEASGGAAVGGPTAPHRRRPWRRPPAGLRHSRAPPPTSRRRGGRAAVASATTLMGTPVDAAATAVAAVAAGRGGWGATSPSGGRAAPRA